MASLRGELIAITGAASGIGLAISHRFASHGALLSLADVNSPALDALKAELLSTFYHNYSATPSPILVTALDVRSSSAVNSWLAATTTHFSPRHLFGAANMAGITGAHTGNAEHGAIQTLSNAEFDAVMDVNCKGLFYCLRAQLGAIRDGGAVVNAASMAGRMGVEWNAPYVASKHAVIGLTRTAAKEEGIRGVRINAIAP